MSAGSRVIAPGSVEQHPPADRSGPRFEREGPRLTGRAAALLVAVTFLGVMALIPARQFIDQRARVADLERQIVELEEGNADLRAEITRLHDPDELERLARACLGMVGPREVAFVTPGGDPTATDC